MLKLMGTLESELTLDQWLAALQREGWQTERHSDSLRFNRDGAKLTLENSGLTLIYGEIEQLESDVADIVRVLAGRADILQIDVFEEDGRMVKRISG